MSTPARSSSATLWHQEDQLILGDVLGNGSSGIAYKAWLGRLPVCAKTLLPFVFPAYRLTRNSDEHKALCRDLEREVDMMWILKHSNILVCHGGVLDRSGLPKHVLTELAPYTLDSFFQSHPEAMTVRLLLRVFRDVLQALAYLHNRIPEAVIHLDIKPDNVFVFEVDGSIQVKIGDVDCARFSSKSGHLSSRHGGAPMFAAPDLFMGQFSTKVDVFSFGIMMSVLILQHLAVPGFPLIPDPLDSSSYGLKGRFTMVGEAVKRLTSVSPELAHVLSKCCELYADHRCTSVEALGLLPELPRTWSHESTVWKPAPTASPPVFFPYHSDSMESTDPSVSSEEGEGRSLSPVIDSSVRVSDLESTESVVGGSGRPLRVYPSTALELNPMTCEYLATVDVGDKGCRGLAVNQDATVLAVSNVGTAKIATFSLSNGSRMREFGAKGSGPGQLMYPQKLCFSPRTGHILIADKSNKRVQEVTLQGSFVREVIVGEQVYGVAASSELLLVDADTKKLLLFDLHTGTLVRSVGEYGLSPGRIDGAYGFRFTPDGLHIIVAERNTRRLSKFAVNGDFVHCFGMDVVTKPFDVDFSEGGEMLVVDEGSNCVHVFTPDGSTRLKTIGSEGGEPGQFSSPTALTIRGGKLYVLDNNSPRVQSYT